MNNLKLYYNLINRGKTERNIEGEIHHIIPKSIYSDKHLQSILNDGTILDCEHNTNYVKLTLREHFIVHILLVKICRNISKNSYIRMLYALNFLSIRSSMSKRYAFFKKQYKQHLQISLTGKPSLAKGHKWSAESKKRRSDDRKNKSYIEFYGKDIAKVIKEKRSQTLINQWKDEKFRNNIVNKLKNISRTEEWNRKNSEAKTGVKLSDSHKQKLREYFSNDKLNPNVDQTYYKFKHNITGNEIIARKIDMKKQYKCNTILRVIRGTQIMSNGWYLIK